MALRRDLIHVTGADALGYLQGQLSADLLAGPGCRWSLLLEPNGKLGWLLLVAVGEHDATISVEAGCGEAVVERLRRFMLRTDASFAVSAAMVERRRLEGEAPDGAWVHDWNGVALADLELDGGDRAPGDDVLAVELGLPANGVELNGELFASALGPAAIGSASSGTKGCYVGQELVARTTSRGTAAPVVLVRVTGQGEVPGAGAALTEGDAALGELTTVVAGSDGWSALGRLRRSGLDATLRCDGREVQVEALS